MLTDFQAREIAVARHATIVFLTRVVAWLSAGKPCNDPDTQTLQTYRSHLATTAEYGYPAV